MPKPLVSDKPYPALSSLKSDPLAVRIISPAYASSSGELNSVLQYVYHSLAFRAAGDGERAELLLSLAIAEMTHLNMLGEALINMGATPVFTAQPPARFNFYSTKFVAYSGSLYNMIEDDVMGEKHAICSYKRMLYRLQEGALKQLIERIVEDEELHVRALKRSLEGLSC